MPMVIQFMAGFVTQACFNVIQALSAILQLARASEGNAIHHFIPLVLKGGIKKIIVISSPHADLSLIKDIVMENNALYVAFKAASNVIIAKFSSQYKRDGALTFSVSHEAVKVGHWDVRRYLFPFVTYHDF
ncbi:hypothetical protein COCC4DRAFT_149529 [Bipolaris maydis ATCC 48331]|uniref:Ketoreductase (KR) domain-containing protein n=2 Tax=Cochliobolus heterostrophus TaxID=5016 RepID=M2V559_COCH5|nr:uncharacterized protein COCC4DRAFT_149529 [Bipolaris maydis ATCC 48331]EMD95138.1 hypothetical protein COCHEDRAFT_1027629 [Bipolaris maydis C5]ENI00971.1 hypothetical protein COCC4DRAFT_149529 [Bipolaris maydis ATCC 48331]KAJ6214164.1 hypothetical protein PSV09DRAFT_1027629 [Bipolaris maydis]